MKVYEAEKYGNGTNRDLYSTLFEHYEVMTYVSKPIVQLIKCVGFTNLVMGGVTEVEAREC